MLQGQSKVAVDRTSGGIFPIKRYGVGPSGDFYFFIAKSNFQGAFKDIKVVLGTYPMGADVKMVFSGRAILKNNLSLARKIWSQSFTDTTEERFVKSNFYFLKVIDVSASMQTG